MKEIERRIEILLEKKNDKKEEKKKIINDLLINFEKKVILKNNSIYTLNEIEIQILKLLLSKKNKIFSRKEILNFLTNSNSTSHFDYRIIDFYISKLRYKIEDEPKTPIYIQTIRGLGYRFYTPKFFNKN